MALKSRGVVADTFHMPIFVTMAFFHESDQPNASGSGESPPMEPPVPGTDAGVSPGQDGVTPERLRQLIRRLETGFYDAPEVREQVARKVREELDP